MQLKAFLKESKYDTSKLRANVTLRWNVKEEESLPAVVQASWLWSPSLALPSLPSTALSAGRAKDGAQK